MSKMKKEHKIFILLAVFGAFLFLSPRYSGREFFSKKSASLLEIKGIKTFVSTADYFSNLALEAKAVYIFNLKNRKEIFARNAEAQMPLASLAKLMAAAVAIENLEPDGRIIISKEAVNQEGDNGFEIGENWRLDDLIDIMLVSSSNDAALAISEEFSNIPCPISRDVACPGKMAELMNRKAKELKLAQTFFLNSTGLDLNKEIAGGYGSAKDIAMLIKYILENEPEILFKTGKETLTVVSLDGKTRAFKNTNQSVNKIPGFIAGKTGYTDLAGGNLAVVFDAGFNHPIVAVILGSSFDGRFEDIEKLAAASYKYLEQN